MKVTLQNVVVPELDHDKMTEREFGRKPSSTGVLERRIVAGLVQHLLDHGFVPFRVFDGEEFTLVTDAKSAMELIFNLDEASLRFTPKDKQRTGAEHGVLLVLGNGEDIISDWNYSKDDGDGFNKAMEAFDAYALR